MMPGKHSTTELPLVLQQSFKRNVFFLQSSVSVLSIACEREVCHGSDVKVRRQFLAVGPSHHVGSKDRTQQQAAFTRQSSSPA